jgi:hypothetical protein
MARKTVLVCDSFGKEIDEGKSAVIRGRRSAMLAVVPSRLISVMTAPPSSRGSRLRGEDGDFA